MGHLAYRDLEKLRRLAQFVTKNMEELRRSGIDFVKNLPTGEEVEDTNAGKSEEQIELERKAYEIGKIISNGAFGCQKDNVRKMMTLLMNIEVPDDDEYKKANENENDPFRGCYNFPGLCWIATYDSFRDGAEFFYITDEETNEGAYGPMGIVTRNIVQKRLASGDITNETSTFRQANPEEIDYEINRLRDYGNWDSSDRISINNELGVAITQFYPSFSKQIDIDLGLEALDGDA